MKRSFYSFISLILLLYTSGSLAQNIQVKGTVKDEGNPLQGVSVFARSTKTTVLTDPKGNFSIQTTKGDTLLFSYTGYLPQQIVIRNQTEFNIALATDIKSLESVVVIGYGTKKKQYL